MAEQANTVKYASRTVYGNNVVAYDFIPARPYYEPQEIPAEIPVAVPKARPRTRAKTAKKAQVAYGISIFAVVGFIAVAAMMFLALLANIKYTEVTNEILDLRTQLEELNEQEKKLIITYESVFDINEIEEYATTVLGMSKPDKDQIGTVRIHTEDKAVILETKNEREGFFSGLTAFLASLVEYFK